MWCDKCNSGPDPKTGNCRCGNPRQGDTVSLTGVVKEVMSDGGTCVRVKRHNDDDVEYWLQARDVVVVERYRVKLDDLRDGTMVKARTSSASGVMMMTKYLKVGTLLIPLTNLYGIKMTAIDRREWRESFTIEGAVPGFPAWKSYRAALTAAVKRGDENVGEWWLS